MAGGCHCLASSDWLVDDSPLLMGVEQVEVEVEEGEQAGKEE